MQADVQLTDHGGSATDELGAIMAELLSAPDAAAIMERLARLAVERVRADGCTIASVVAQALQVAANVDGDRHPGFADAAYLAGQPALKEARETGDIVLAGSFVDAGRTDPTLSAAWRGVKRTAIVPLKLGDDVSGLLILTRRGDGDFALPSLEWLQAVGVIAMHAVRNARLLGEANASQHRGLDALTQISRHVASSDTLPGFFGRMSETVATLARAHRAAFWMIEGDYLVAQSESYGFARNVMAGLRPPLRSVVEGGLARLLFEGQAFRYRVPLEPSDTEVGILIGPSDVRDLLAVPWRTAEGVLGMLVAYDSITGFTAQDEWIMRLAARTSAIVWQGYKAEQRANELQAQYVARLELHAHRMMSMERHNSDFLKLASHELRGPIAVVGGYLSMLADGTLGELPAPIHSVVPKMARRLDQMKEMVNEMISAARVEEGRLPLKLDDTRIDELVRSVVAAVDQPGVELPSVVVDTPVQAHAFADPTH